MFFASDNTSGAAPEILAAIASANPGSPGSYGADALTARVTERVREVFEAPQAAVFLVATGTAANALAIATLTRPWGAVYTHPDAHVALDECGAPEFYAGGAKLVPVAGNHGRMTPDALRTAILSTPQGFVHSVQRGMVSLTNLTEAGTAYRPNDVRALAAVAKEFGLPVHMDGSRIANALAATGASPAEMTWRAGVDALSLGGTKNGCLGVEAVVFFDPEHAWEFELRRKRGGHLFSKHRFLAAQMDAYLTDGLWLRLATQANARAAALARGIAVLPGASFLHPPDGNMVFARFPRAAHRRARAEGAAYYLSPETATVDGPDDKPLGARLVASWNTTDEEVARFLRLLSA